MAILFMELTAAVSAFSDYLQLEKRFSAHSVVAYTTDLQQAISFLSEQYEVSDAAGVTASMVRTWLASLKEQGMESRTINRKLSALKSFYRYLLRRQIITTSPLTSLKGPKTARKLPSFAGEKEIIRLWEQVPFPDNWTGLTEKLAMMLLYQTGMRRSELIRLSEQQIDAGQRQLRVLGKGNKERIIPVSQPLLEAVENYRNRKRTELKNPDTQVLLVDENGKPLYEKWVYRMSVKYMGLVTSLSKRSPHILRHTFATHLANAGADLNAIKELLGHASLAATQVYTHNTIEQLKAVHRQAHPKA